MDDGAEPTYEVLRSRNLAMIGNISRAEDLAWRRRLGQRQGAAPACGPAGRTLNRMMPDPVRRPPDNPPPEPIIIKIPPRPPEAPEVDRSDDDDEAEIRTPLIVPEMPPPPRPEECPVAAPWFAARS
jgi:hypothetical protein